MEDAYNYCELMENLWEASAAFTVAEIIVVFGML
jgi:hypothetical protein